jgi:YesN/AraC family two-component response regulator
LTDRHSLLWIDMTISVHDPEVTEGFRKRFAVHRLSTPVTIDAEIERLRPAVLCFDFDFPTKHGLKLLQTVKQTHASLPLLMLTVEHSESLAVWAFRSRVWDYLVKPVASRDLERCLGKLIEMLDEREALAPPRKAAMPVSVIPEENRTTAPRGQGPLELAPALSYVEKNYREKLSSSEAASLCGLTTFQFSRLFRETYGLTFQDYMLRFRIREACRLLENPNAHVADVAFLCGFNDPSYFGKIFKRYTNVSPSQYSELAATEFDADRLLEALSND